jgi:hypothetical protein
MAKAHHGTAGFGFWFQFPCYAAFLVCWAFTRAHLALAAAAILLRPSGDNLRFAGALPVDLAAEIGCDPFRNFAHLALWA